MANYTSLYTGAQIDNSVASGSTTTGRIVNTTAGGAPLSFASGSTDTFHTVSPPFIRGLVPGLKVWDLNSDIVGTELPVQDALTTSPWLFDNATSAAVTKVNNDSDFDEGCITLATGGSSGNQTEISTKAAPFRCSANHQWWAETEFKLDDHDVNEFFFGVVEEAITTDSWHLVAAAAGKDKVGFVKDVHSTDAIKYAACKNGGGTIGAAFTSAQTYDADNTILHLGLHWDGSAINYYLSKRVAGATRGPLTLLQSYSTTAGIPDDSNLRLALYHEAGEAAAQERLSNFLQSKADLYSESRNSPIIDGTSRISPYLALGILSPKRCILEGLKLNNFEFTSGNKGICKWIDEIIWREFYRNIMYSFPRVSQNKPFQDYTNAIKWRHSNTELKAFYEGKTGFPIVDAGIRQMLAEGWMHNRLRMVVAMFFTKNMLHDWRLGERFFMQNLIDGDFSSNNGGWQWSSSTGTDSAPYFRIFNPITQSQNFDPKGEFIKHFIPELKDVPINKIHQPQIDLFSSYDYPEPILDLKESRLRAIQAFKDAREEVNA